MKTKMTDDELAGKLYTRYCAVVGGVAYDGKPLPGWEEFSRDPKKAVQWNGWVEVARLASVLASEN